MIGLSHVRLEWSQVDAGDACTIMAHPMVRPCHIVLLACVLPGAVLPSFITAKLISPVAQEDERTELKADKKHSSLPVDPALPKGTDWPYSAPNPDPLSPNRGGDGQDSYAGFSALRPTASEVPGQSARSQTPCRFCGMAEGPLSELALGHTLMPGRLGRVVAASRCVATGMAAIAPKVLPHGPPRTA